MGDEREGLQPVGEHECVTCLRCACTFASVHPACPRCSEADRAEARVGQLTQELQEQTESSKNWHVAYYRERQEKLRAERRITELEAALTEVLDNAMAHHSGEEGKARALSVIARAVRAVLSTSKEETDGD